MLRLLVALLPTLRAALRSRRDLVIENLALRQQLATLASRRHPVIWPADRLFWILLRRLWSGWAKSLAIVQPDTVVRWHRAGFRTYWDWLSRRGKHSGRHPLPHEVRALIRRMASENAWGAPRIHGELLRLGLEVSERSVSRYLRTLPRTPRPGQTWTTFLQNHRVTVPTAAFRVLDFSPHHPPRPPRGGPVRHHDEPERCLGCAATSRDLSLRVGAAFHDLRPRFPFRGRSADDAALYAKKSIFGVNILPAFGDRRLDRVGAPEQESYKNTKLKEGYSKKTINNHLAALGKMLTLARDWGLVGNAPKMNLFRVEPSDFEFLTFEETPRFMAAVPPEWKTFAIVPLKTGLRVGELLALKWEDLDLVAGRVMVRRTLWNKEEVLPKGGSVREVPLGNDVIAALKAHRHLRGPYVFCDEAGHRLTHSKVKRVVPGACAKAGLAKRLTTHGLRHTFASHLVMLGQSLKAVQELLGHTTIEMTMRYAHLSPDVKRDAVRSLDSLPAGKSTPGVEQVGSNGVEE